MKGNNNAKPKPQGIPGQDKVSQEAIAEVRYLLENFERVKERRFEFERIIGEGSFGVTCKMKMRQQQRPAPTPALKPKPLVRRFVMKRSLNDKGKENIREEIKWIRVGLPSSHLQGRRLFASYLMLSLYSRNSKEPSTFPSRSILTIRTPKTPYHIWLAQRYCSSGSQMVCCMTLSREWATGASRCLTGCFGGCSCAVSDWLRSSIHRLR